MKNGKRIGATKLRCPECEKEESNKDAPLSRKELKAVPMPKGWRASNRMTTIRFQQFPSWVKTFRGFYRLRECPSCGRHWHTVETVYFDLREFIEREYRKLKELREKYKQLEAKLKSFESKGVVAYDSAVIVCGDSPACSTVVGCEGETTSMCVMK
jgi:hypothetical protein